MAREELAERMGISRADRELSRFVGRAMEGVTSLKRAAADIQFGGDPEKMLAGLHKVEAASARLQHIAEGTRRASMESFGRAGEGMTALVRGLAQLSGADEQLERISKKLAVVQAGLEAFRGAKEVIAAVVGGVSNLNKALEAGAAAAKVQKGVAEAMTLLKTASTGAAAAEAVATAAAGANAAATSAATKANAKYAGSAATAAKAEGLELVPALIAARMELRGYRADADEAARANLRLALSAKAAQLIEGGGGGAGGGGRIAGMLSRLGSAGASEGVKALLGWDGAAATVPGVGGAIAGGGGEAVGTAGGILSWLGGGAALGSGVALGGAGAAAAIGLAGLGAGVTATVDPDSGLDLANWLFGEKSISEQARLSKEGKQSWWKTGAHASAAFLLDFVGSGVDPQGGLYSGTAEARERLAESNERQRRMEEARAEKDRRNTIFSAGYEAGRPYQDRIFSAQDSAARFQVEGRNWRDEAQEFDRRLASEKPREELEKWFHRAMDPRFDQLGDVVGADSGPGGRKDRRASAVDTYGDRLRALMQSEVYGRTDSSSQGTPESRARLAQAQQELEMANKRAEDATKRLENAEKGKSNFSEGSSTEAEVTTLKGEQADAMERQLRAQQDMSRAEHDQAVAERDRLERLREMLHTQAEYFKGQLDQLELQRSQTHIKLGLKSPAELSELERLSKKLDDELAHPGEIRPPRTVWHNGHQFLDPGSSGRLSEEEIAKMQQYREIFGHRLDRLGDQRADQFFKAHPGLREHLDKERAEDVARAKQGLEHVTHEEQEAREKAGEQNRKAGEAIADKAGKEVQALLTGFVDRLTELMKQAVSNAQYKAEKDLEMNKAHRQSQSGG